MAAPLRRWLSQFIIQKQSVGASTASGLLWKPCRGYSQQAQAQATPTQGQRQKWQLVSAVCLERPAVIAAPRSQLQQDFQDLMDNMEFEDSHLSVHELRHLDDLNLAEKRKQEDYEDTEADAIRQTAVEAEDAWEAELQAFTPADTVTDADRKGELTSLDRKLQDKLVLLVKQKFGDEEFWTLPQIPHQDGESMRQCAERALSRLCGSGLKAKFLGNAPCGFYKYRFPPQSEPAQDAVGSKIFFFKAQLMKGNAEVSDPAFSAFKWVTRSELGEEDKLPAYKKELLKFIQPL